MYLHTPDKVLSYVIAYFCIYFFLCLQVLVKHIITIGIKSIAKTPITLLEVY